MLKFQHIPARRAESKSESLSNPDCGGRALSGRERERHPAGHGSGYNHGHGHNSSNLSTNKHFFSKEEPPKDLLKFINTIPSSEAKVAVKDLGNSESSNDYLWVQCWIDYTNKDCGFAYRISNDTVGVKLKVNKISYIVKRNINQKGGDIRYEYYLGEG